MNQIKNFSDGRLAVSCAYCDGGISTRDHVPSKVFLDEPYPENIHVVPACTSCNQSFSIDEEYVACLIECMRAGSVFEKDIKRSKISRILLDKPALFERLRKACLIREHIDGYDTMLSVETDRLKNIMLKLARGHAYYELSEHLTRKPSTINIYLLPYMKSGVREAFEHVPRLTFTPEIGSRAMQRALVFTRPEESALIQPWVEVQPDQYRYLAWSDIEGAGVRIVISEYLASEIFWESDDHIVIAG